MPFPRRGGRRRPFINSRWQIRRLETLCLFLSPAVRSTLTAWMKIYGETNDVPGLVSGPIEVRFRRLREHTGADVFLLWTTPESWAAGEALSFWIPAIGLALECKFDDGRLVCDKARPTTQEERDPRRQRSAIGMELRPDTIELPTDAAGDNPSAGLVASFERLLDRRWTSFVDPLREALEAEARDDAARAERLATPYAVSTPRIGSQSESDPYRLSGVEASAVAAFDEGEWLDLVDTRGRVISSARLVRIDPAEGVMDVDVRGADPPSEGVVRPRPQTQILAQKRAIIEELDNPTGALANAVKLVASPASLVPPQRRRPATFVNRLVAQNRSQVRAVSLALGLEEGQALMIQGPPGTGKSTTLAEVLGQLVTRDKNVTVLVCSHSNHGVDNLLLKTLPYLESIPDLAIARVGLFDRVHPLARPHFVPPGEDLGAFNVVFTTVDALALQVEAGARTYDYAVLDEANRASILDSLIPLVRGRRFVLVGDHLQLQPVLSEAEEALRLEPAVGNTSAIGKSLFAWLRERRFPEAATIFLDEQNRMHPVIAGLISEVFYEGKLRSGRKAPRRVADVPLFPAAVTWVDTRGLHGLREARGRGASLVNVPEARLVATIARHILGSSHQRQVEVGVISAYAEQTALLRRLLLHRNNQRQNGANGTANPRNNVLDRNTLKLLEIDTVDAFEGREKDIIIVSLVRSNRRRDIGFLRLMQRINVALSRAKTMLIVVGDTSTLRGSYFDRIVRYVRANGMLVPGPRLIGRLLNERNIDRTAERPGERPGLPGRRRRPLPSARTAFPVRDPATPAAPTGPNAEGAGVEDGDGQRGRRRRRRVRGRPGSERPGVERRGPPPSTTMEMAPAVEPADEEPATQYEIDRFAALVEQLLGDTSGDEAAEPGAEAPAVAEVDRAHAEEVLADALRAVSQQAERAGSSRSRRTNNRRRGRRGQPRPLPGDAAVADAARRMAREELLADAESGESAATGEAPDAQYVFDPGDEPADALYPPAAVFEPFDLYEPTPEDVSPAFREPMPEAPVSERPRRTRRQWAADVPDAAADSSDAAMPVAAAPSPSPELESEAVHEVPRRIRRRAVAAGEPFAETPAAPPAPVELPASDPAEPGAPVRRTRRRVAATAEPVTPTEMTAPAEPAPSAIQPPAVMEAPRPRVTRPRTAAAVVAEPEPPAVPAPVVALEPVAEAAPAPATRRTRRRVTEAADAPASEAAATPGDAQVNPDSSPLPLGEGVRRPAARRTRAAVVEPAPVAPVGEPPVAPSVEEALSAPAPARSRRRTTTSPASAAEAQSIAEAPSVDAPPAPPAARRRRAMPAADAPAAPAPAVTESLPAQPAPRPRRSRVAAAAPVPDVPSAVGASPVEAAPSESVAPSAPKPRRSRAAASAAAAPNGEVIATPTLAANGATVPGEDVPAPKPRGTRRKVTAAAPEAAADDA